MAQPEMSRPQRTPPRPTRPTPPLPLSPQLSAIQSLLEEMARDERTARLVDYLCDLRGEMLWVVAALAELDFDAHEFLCMVGRKGGEDFPWEDM